MKEFDIFLNKRLTECDIIVYSIPYRDELTIVDRLILESCLESYILQKFVALQFGSELVAHIDEMIKTCYEKLNLGVEIGASVAFQKHNSIYPKEIGVEISQEKVKLLSVLLTDAENAIQIATAPLLAQIAKSPGRGSSEIILEQSVRDTLKTDIEKFAPPLLISAVAPFIKHDYDRFDTKIEIYSELPDIFYRFYAGTGSNMLLLSSEVLAITLYCFLGYVETNIVIGADVSDGDFATKYEVASNVVSILADVIESIIQIVSPSDHAIQIVSEVTAIKRRHRLLYELDPDTLQFYDDMSLEDVDYVII